MNEYVDLSLGLAERPGRSWKGAVRVIGVAESFQKSDPTSICVGVVMRGDLHIDGFGICRPTVGGLDATTQMERMFERMNRRDLRAWILGGSIISWFNVVDINRLREATGIPVVSVTYSDSEGIDKYLREYFPDDWVSRAQVIESNGPRHELVLNTGHRVFVNIAGMNQSEALKLLNLFTWDGKIPEPVRLARLFAASIRRDGYIL